MAQGEDTVGGHEQRALAICRRGCVRFLRTLIKALPEGSPYKTSLGILESTTEYPHALDMFDFYSSRLGNSIVIEPPRAML